MCRNEHLIFFTTRVNVHVMFAIFQQHFPPKPGRLYEAFGPTASSFAAAVCGMQRDQVMWISSVHDSEILHPEGLARFCEPSLINFAKASNLSDLLWMSEECLRSAALGVVVVELSEPISFTAARRLQLAATVGNAVAITLISEASGNNASEMRWRCSPVLDHNLGAGDSTLQEWEIIKNKKGTLLKWKVNWDDASHRIAVVSEAFGRTDGARAEVKTLERNLSDIPSREEHAKTL